MSRIFGIATPNTDDPECVVQQKLLSERSCAMIIVRKKERANSFRESIFQETSPGDVLLACKLENFARNLIELSIFFQQALSRELHIQTVDGLIDSRIETTRNGIESFLAAGKQFNRQRSIRILAEAKLKGQTLGRKPRFADSDWTRIRNKLLIKPLKEVAKEEGVNRMTIYKFIERMGGI